MVNVTFGMFEFVLECWVTNISKVFIGYPGNLVVACIEICCFLWQCRHGCHVRSDLFTVHRSSQTHTEQASWKL